MERFQDENKWLASFGDVIDVKCPNCGQKAVVKRTFESTYYYRDQKILECKNCHYSKKENTVKYIAHVDSYCCNNVDKVEYKSQLLNKKPDTIKLKCPVCKEIKAFKPKIEEIRFEFSSDGLSQTESWFNAVLWYQKELGGNLFWAYNLDHIDYLQRYIQADLRERNPKVNGGGTMAARLPQFVKAAKNREKLLKILKKWKE
ncbi:hypothetical protein [Flavobacterium hungaricum]|uniref:Uncharacterized protein n=1 Tax=Flavobacterium hungaricum TaxID=2082725 RepID=A0ABR9TFS7_9FLAO|nr:hypothetical protein [Flavobacterium hungaricum]MBE8724146.1 hypothetical protein [Flavobacterium hungaricum]